MSYNTNNCLHESQAQSFSSHFSWLKKKTWLKKKIAFLIEGYHHWCDLRDTRDAFASLLLLEEEVLRDLGYCRDELLELSRLPLHINAALELEKRRKARQKRLRARHF